MPRVIPPSDDPDDRHFWEGVERRQLLIQRCTGCKALRHPPAPMCPGCSSLEWDTRAASGRGTVYSWVASRHPTEPDDEPRIVALLDLEEGIRFVSNLVDIELEDIRHGLPVELVFLEVDGVLLPQFRPRAEDG